MKRRVLAGCAVAVSIAALWAAPAGAVTIVVTPSTVPRSGTVTVSGDVLFEGKVACDSVLLISDVFSPEVPSPGNGAVLLPVDATGHFSRAVALNPSAGPGTYTIGGRCGGGTLPVQATVTVTATELARTGSSFGPLSDVEALVLGIGLVLAGGAAATLARRPRRPIANANRLSPVHEVAATTRLVPVGRSRSPLRGVSAGSRRCDPAGRARALRYPCESTVVLSQGRTHGPINPLRQAASSSPASADNLSCSNRSPVASAFAVSAW